MSPGRRGAAVAGLAVAVLGATVALAADAPAPAPAPTPAEARALALPQPRRALSAQRIYFVMTDRFANASTANDRGGITGLPGKTGFDPTDPGFFHGGDLEGLTARLPYVKRLGMTAIWVTPPVVQRTVQGASAGYHGYWGTDFTTVDPHFGGRDAFARFVERAHALGLKVILDVVVNHTGDVISYEGAGAAGAVYVDQASKPYRDTDGEAFDPTRVAGTGAFPDIFPDSRTFPYDPVVAEEDEGVKRPDWLNDLRNYHNRGDSTFAGESTTFGDVYGLDDLFTERPEVVEGEIALWSQWIRDYGLDGFRLDTLQHVGPAFWRSFLPAIERAAAASGRPGFSVFGEVYDQAATARTVRRLGLESVLDFSFQTAAVAYAAGAGDASTLSDLFDQDDLYTTPSTSAYELATFLGNHDIGRVGFGLLRASGGDRAVALRHDLLAHDLLFLLRGAPIVYYGDEVGMTGSGEGTDKAARQDMFATRVAAWKTEPRLGGPPAGNRPSYDLGNPVARRIAALAALTSREPALRNGAQITRLARGGVFAVSRIDATRRLEYVVAFGNGPVTRTVTVPTSSPRTRFLPIHPAGGTAVPSDAAGRLAVTVPGGGAVVLRAARPLPPAPSVSITLARPSLDALAGVFRLRATVPGSDPATVTFAFRSAGTSGWERLGSDDARPFRLALEPGRFVVGRAITVVAVARSSSGAVAVSRPVVLVRR